MTGISATDRQNGRPDALAVLLALLDCCTVGTDASGNAPGSISTRDLARRVLELYWPQVRDYALPAGGAVVLRQSSQPRAVTVDAVRRLRTRASSIRATTPASAGRDYPRFLYDDSAFHENVSARQVRATSMRVVLEPEVGDWLVSLAGLLRPLLELHWTREVAKFNGTELSRTGCGTSCSGAAGEPRPAAAGAARGPGGALLLLR